MTMPRTESDERINRELARLGRGQRIAGGILATVMTALALSVAIWPVPVRLGVVLAGFVPLVFAMRIRIRLEDDVLLVRGHLRTRAFPLPEILAFNLEPYEGWWNGGVGSTGWTNFGLRMIAVIGDRGPGGDLPESMCSISHGERIVESLNSRLTTHAGH